MKSTRRVLSGLALIALCACGDAPPEEALGSVRGVRGERDAGAAGQRSDGGGDAGDGSLPEAGMGALAPDAPDAMTGGPFHDGVHGDPAVEDGLPVVHLWVSNDVNGSGYLPARFFYRGRELPGVHAKLRGKTSLMYPKKSFTVKFAKGALFDEPEHDMLGRRRIVLTTTFDDNTHVRQRLAFTLWNLLQPQILVQAYNAVLYLNGRYHGLYMLGDHVDDELMEESGLWSGGNLYKARTHDANLGFHDRNGRYKRPLEEGYTKEEGAPAAGEPGAFDDLHALMDWLSHTAEHQLVAEADRVLDRADFEAWRVLVSAIEATDSAGKNGYLYHDPRPDAPDSRWHYVPWDFNASFGQNWATWRYASDRPLSDYDEFNVMFERWSIAPDLKASLVQRFRTALAGELSRERVLALFDEFSAEVADAATRDATMWDERARNYPWGGRGATFGTHAEERAYVRNWIDERWKSLSRQLGTE